MMQVEPSTCSANFVVDQKLDKIIDTLGTQAVTLERLTVTVEEHVSRTNKLENIVLPIQQKINYVEGALKLVGFLALLGTIAEGVASWIKH